MTLTFVTFKALASRKDFIRSTSLDREDIPMQLCLSALACDFLPFAIMTDGLFGLTRTKQSTCDVMGIILPDDNHQRNLILAYLKRCLYHGSTQPLSAAGQWTESTDKQSRNYASQSLRREANAFRNRERKETIAMIRKAYESGDLGDVRSHKAIATRDNLIARVRQELPVITAGRELAKMLEYWHLLPSPQYKNPILAHAEGHLPNPNADNIFHYLQSSERHTVDQYGGAR